MAFTRKMLKAMGIEDEKIEQIIDAHIEVTDSLKAERDSFKNKADQVEDLTKQVDELKKAAEGDGFEKRYTEVQAEFDRYKAEVESEKVKTAKANAFRTILSNAGIDPKRFDAIIKVTDLDNEEFSEGAFTNAAALADGVKSEWADFIKTEGANRANVDNPPNNDGAGDEVKNIHDALKQRYSKEN